MRAILKVLIVAALSLGCAARSPEVRAKSAVASHINRALAAGNQQDQQREFDRIVAMGCDAVPELAAHLGDNRELPIPYLRLENRSPKAFEAFRQYGPETVTDAVAALLNHITGQHFGFIYNGGTDEERSSSVRAWKSYLRETPSDQVCRSVTPSV